LLFGRLAAWVRAETGWESAARVLLGSAPEAFRRDLELLGKAGRQPLTAFAYCFCDLRRTP
jgi:hypothetical protein